MVTEASGRPGHLPALDGLRAVAVCLVMVAHLPGVAGMAASHAQSFAGIAGYLGVDLFFVLSGFLITRILISDATREAPLQRFWARRFLRIFPAYYLLLGAVWLLSPRSALPWCAAYVSNYYFAISGDHDALLGHTWSLAVEEHFYLVWPIVATRLSPRSALQLLLITIMPLSLGAAVVTNAFEVPHAASLTYEGTHARAWSLGLGCALALLPASGWHLPPRLSGRAAALLAISGVVAWACTIAVARTRLGPVGFMLGYAWVSTVVLLFALHPPHPLLMRFATAPVPRHVGELSYGLYLYHVPVYSTVSTQAAGLPPPVRVALAVLLTYVVARVSFTCVERPLLGLRERFR